MRGTPPHLADRIVSMFSEEGMKPVAIAATLNEEGVLNSIGNPWSSRTVGRTLFERGHSVPRPAPPLSESEKERIVVLRREGMPSTLVMRELGRRDKDLISRVGVRLGGVDNDAMTAEWRQAWSAIRRSPELLALHREFFPSPGD